MSRYARWTRQDDETLKTMTREGKTAKQIAFKLNRTELSIYVRRKKLDCTTRTQHKPYPITSEQVDYIIENYPKRGQNGPKIARHLGIPAHVVHHQATKFELKPWTYKDWKPTKKEIEWLKNERIKGVGYRKVGEGLNVPHAYVKRWVEENIP